MASGTVALRMPGPGASAGGATSGGGATPGIIPLGPSDGSAAGQLGQLNGGTLDNSGIAIIIGDVGSSCVVLLKMHCSWQGEDGTWVGEGVRWYGFIMWCNNEECRCLQKTGVGPGMCLAPGAHHMVERNAAQSWDAGTQTNGPVPAAPCHRCRATLASLSHLAVARVEVAVWPAPSRACPPCLALRRAVTGVKDGHHLMSGQECLSSAQVRCDACLMPLLLLDSACGWQFDGALKSRSTPAAFPVASPRHSGSSRLTWLDGRSGGFIGRVGGAFA